MQSLKIHIIYYSPADVSLFPYIFQYMLQVYLFYFIYSIKTKVHTQFDKLFVQFD